MHSFAQENTSSRSNSAEWRSSRSFCHFDKSKVEPTNANKNWNNRNQELKNEHLSPSKLPRLIEDPLAFQQFEQRCLKPADIVLREIAGRALGPVAQQSFHEPEAGAGLWHVCGGGAIGNDAPWQRLAVILIRGKLRLRLVAGRRLGLAGRDVLGLDLPPGGRRGARWHCGLGVVLGHLLCGERGQRNAVLAPDLHDEARPLLLQDPLDALDRVPLAVEKMADAAQEIDIIRPVIASAAAALERADLREPGFPETQDVLRQIEIVCDLADRAKGVGAFFDRR